MLEWAKRPWQEGLRPLQAKNPHAAGMEAGQVRTADPLAPPLPARSMSEPTGSSSTMASRLSILRLERSLARLNIKRSRSPEKRRAPRAAAQTERKPVPPMLPIPESAQSERKPKARPLDEGRLRRPRGRPISMAYHAAKILVGGDGRAALADEILRHASANFVQEAGAAPPARGSVAVMRYLAAGQTIESGMPLITPVSLLIVKPDIRGGLEE